MEIADRIERDRAASELDRNLVVVAGAGTGKTSLLVERVLHLVLERGAPIERIASMTFTEKAAAEMRLRVEEGLEALTRLLGESDRDPGPAVGQEATRVLRRIEASRRRGLDDADRQLFLERARLAVESLDDAPITTIHGFASEMLRRHPREAGVDPAFEVDVDERGARALFDELWSEHLVEVFGAGAPAETTERWRPLLATLPMEDVEQIARRLSGFRLGDAVLADACDGQRVHLGAFAELALAELRDLRDVTRNADGVNRNVPHVLSLIEKILGRIAGGEPPDAECRALIDKLPKSVKIGAKAVVADPPGTQTRITDLLKWCRLEKLDCELAGRLADCLVGFVERFRREYLERGWLSFDGMIVLARDLLRDNPRVRGDEARRLDHILIDEFQDNDPLQYEIAFLLSSADVTSSGADVEAHRLPLAPGKLFIVGDPKQSIYRFRGADIDAYSRAVRAVERGGGAVLELRSNFRSVPRIVEPLNTLFESSFAGDGRFDPPFAPITAAREDVDEPRVEIWSVGELRARALDRRRAEAITAAAWIEEQVSGGALRYRDVAILLRALSEVGIYLRMLRERGIPYVLAGGKEFYERHEVAVLLAFLRAVINPADQVALVSWLRSPVAAVPDRELQEHAMAVGAWSIFAEPDGGKLPRLAAALAMIREFHQRHRDAMIDELAAAALVETPLRLAMAASFEGAQRVANLEKAVRKIAGLAADGRSSAEAVLDHIEQVEALDRAEGDSPLADETVDAVRVLTIHGAKGLEWPVVFVADVARGQQGQVDAIQVETTTARSGGPPSGLALRAGNRETPAWLLRTIDEAAHERAESKRLLYVAATRARERLILLAGWPRSVEKSWVIALRAWGYEIDGEFPPEGMYAGGAVIHRRIESPHVGRPRPADVEVDNVLVAAARAHDRARESAALAAGEWLRSPSGLRERSELADDAPAGEGAPTVERGVVAAAGTAVHLLLEVWDGREESWMLENAARAARVAAAGEGVPPREVETEVVAIVERAAKDGTLARLARLPALARELPVLYRDDTGIIWHGSIDLVTGTSAAPEVIDFKTTSAGEEEIEARSRAQLECYREGLRRALGLTSAPPARVERLVRG